MSIPLDRLYDFLCDLVNRDVIIYRWMPHGSKNLNNLGMHNARYTKFIDWARAPKAVFHDQEPLDYFYYTKNDFLDLFKDSPGFEDESDSAANLIVHHPKAFDEYYDTCDLSILFYSTVTDKQILVHSEINSEDVQLYQQAGFVPVYYWSHGLISRDWFRYAEVDPSLNNQCNNIQSDFLIYNRAWSGSREYRLYWAQELANYKLESVCKTSFSPYDNNVQYLQHQFKNNKFQIARTDLTKIYSQNTAPPTASADYVSADYNLTGIEVVLETLFDTTKIHLTEKTLRPIACGHPFILVAAPGALSYLRGYGFNTFGELIDESYDNINDPVERMHCILKEMQRISSMPLDKKTKLFYELRKTANHNRKHFFSKDFYNQLTGEFVTNFLHGYQIITDCTTSYRWHKMHKFVTTRLSEHYDTIYPEVEDGVDEYTWLSAWAEQRRLGLCHFTSTPSQPAAGGDSI